MSKQPVVPMDIPVWDGMVDCWQGYTAGALERQAAGQPVLYGAGRIHIHWGVLWGSRPRFFQLEQVTSARGSNDWTRTQWVDLDPCLPSAWTPDNWQTILPLYDLLTEQWAVIDEHLTQQEWVVEPFKLRDGTSIDRVCNHQRITRSLAHLFETHRVPMEVL